MGNKVYWNRPVSSWTILSLRASLLDLGSYPINKLSAILLYAVLSTLIGWNFLSGQSDFCSKQVKHKMVLKMLFMESVLPGLVNSTLPSSKHYWVGSVNSFSSTRYTYVYLSMRSSTIIPPIDDNFPRGTLSKNKGSGAEAVRAFSSRKHTPRLGRFSTRRKYFEIRKWCSLENFLNGLVKYLNPSNQKEMYPKCILSEL